jgi:hypothetical protein
VVGWGIGRVLAEYGLVKSDSGFEFSNAGLYDYHAEHGVGDGYT